MLDEDFPSLAPASFFGIECDVRRLDEQPFPLRIGEKERQSYRLPDPSAITDELPFASVSMGWHPEGMAFFVDVDKSIERVSYPDLQYTDSVELFVDTRDRKTAGFATRFCHHFFFLPEPYLAHRMAEITRFRTDDQHPLCGPESLYCQTVKRKESYALEIFIPSNCLTGYDPSQFRRCGFTYRINRPDGRAQHFSVLSSEYPLEQQPSLWARLHFVEPLSA